ncbi:MAG: TauD/TfdA family dioxygenase [Pseudomonadota bacterium]
MYLTATESPIGGDLNGIDLSTDLSDADITEFKRCFFDRSVIVARNQTLAPHHLLRIARWFGEPDQHFLKHYAHPDEPQVLVLSNIIDAGKPRGFADAGRVWHSDGSYMQTPVAVTLLYALEVPHDNGRALGDTQFASAWAACDGLPVATREKARGQEVVHQVGGRRRDLGTGRSSDRAEEDRQPEAFHPALRVHPETGREYIFVSKGECRQVVGMPDEEALCLIDELAEAVQRPEYRYTHRWQVGDLLIWDNQAVQHLASFDYQWPQHRRLMHRVTVPEPTQVRGG